MEKKKKMVSINVDAMKEKAADAAKGAAAAVGARLAAAGKAVGDKAKTQKDKAVAIILDKSIELSEKQLKALEGRRSRI